MNDKKSIVKLQNWLDNKSDKIQEFSENGHLISDPTRVKILLLLSKHKELCVTDLANVLGISISAVSHQLSKLERLRMVTSVKDGKTVCYYFGAKNKKLETLLKFNNL